MITEEKIFTVYDQSMTDKGEERLVIENLNLTINIAHCTTCKGLGEEMAEKEAKFKENLGRGVIQLLNKKFKG